MNFLKKFLGFSIKTDNSEEMIYGATDCGRIRKNNEDYFLFQIEKNLFIVADGMGGHSAGEIASMNATEAVNSYFTAEILSEIAGNSKKIKEESINSLLHAHQKVLQMAESKSEYHDMGCTIVVALTDGNNLHLCHIGDARAYIADNTGIRLLTKDHSLVMKLVEAQKMTIEEARHSPMKNEITQAIGVPMSISPEYNCYPLKQGDKILLCSDGLWDMLSDDEIYEILKQKISIKMICEELIQMANDAGGRDNITVLVIEHQAKENLIENDMTIKDVNL